jgi:hypothetical protein
MRVASFTPAFACISGRLAVTVDTPQPSRVTRVSVRTLRTASDRLLDPFVRFVACVQQDPHNQFGGQ